MKCMYCGNEIPTGQAYCSCGHAVQFSDPSATSSVKIKRSGPSVPKWLIMLVVVGLLGGFFQYFRTHLGFTWEFAYRTVYEDEYTIKIPILLTKSDDYGDDNTVSIEGFYTSDKAAVNIAKLSYDEVPMFEEMDIKEIALLAGMSGFDSEFKEGDGFVYAAYTDSASTALGTTQRCYVIEGLFKGDDGIWSVNAYCRSQDREELEDYLLKWVESFKLT